MSETARPETGATETGTPDSGDTVPVDSVERHLSSTPVLSSGAAWSGITAQVHDGFVFPRRQSVPPLSDHGMYIHLEQPTALERWLEDDGGDHTQAKAGDMTIVPADTSTAWKWNRPIRILHLYLEPTLLHRAAETAADVDPDRIELIPRLSKADPLVEQVGQAIVTELREGASDAQLYAEQAAEMLAVHLLRNHCSIEAEVKTFTGGVPPARLQRVKDYVEAHLSDDIRLAQLAEEAEMSRYHFSRQFKKSVGQSPTQYVIDRRIEEGKGLLEETDWLISRIALEVGYASQSSFTTQFKRRVGATPGTYRSAKK